MPKASVKRLIECKKEQLIDLVLDIEQYPKFVPFCIDSKVYERNEKGDLFRVDRIHGRTIDLDGINEKGPSSGANSSITIDTGL